MKHAQLGRPDYIHYNFVYFLCLCRPGETQKAESHIRAFCDTLQEDKWLAPVAHFYAGDISEGALLHAANTSDPEPDSATKCEAYYYIRMLHALREGPLLAKDSLRGGER